MNIIFFNLELPESEISNLKIKQSKQNIIIQILGDFYPKDFLFFLSSSVYKPLLL